MKKEDAVEITLSYMNAIFSYVSRRISDEQERQDVAQDICLKLYRSLCLKEIAEVEHYVWVVAKHTLANYYRRQAKKHTYLEDMQVEICDEKPGALEQIIDRENRQKLCREIAYLSKTQRQVIIQYYYEDKKLKEIADSLNIPLGTVKWHLNAAKQELRKGMENMRNQGNLQFNPITMKFGLCGSTGDMGEAGNMFRSRLSQNIVYSIYCEAKTINEIAEELAVSPVYVESELEFLEKMSLVTCSAKKYLANILIDESGSEIIERQKAIYEKAAKVAIDLYDAMKRDFDLAGSTEIFGAKEEHTLMWSLLFYLLHWQEEKEPKKISFEEAAEYRVDGGHNIIWAQVENNEIKTYFEEMGMDIFSGPCWNTRTWEDGSSATLWVMDGNWTEERVTEHYGGPNIARDMTLLKRFAGKEKLHSDDYAYLAQKGYIREENGEFILKIPVLLDGELCRKLLTLAKEIKEKAYIKLAPQIEEYKKLVLEKTPKQVKRQQEYLLQSMFLSDGFMILYAKKALVESGRLKMPKAEERLSISEMLILK